MIVHSFHRIPAHLDGSPGRSLGVTLSVHVPACESESVAESIAALLLAGCTASTGAIGNIYVLSVNYNDGSQSRTTSSSLFQEAANGGQVTVRAGYFGLCAQTVDQGTRVCASGASGLSLILANGGRNDPLNAMGFAEHFKGDVIFPGLL